MIRIDGLDPRRSTFYNQQLTLECLTKSTNNLYLYLLCYMTNNLPQNVWPSWRQEESFGSCCRFCRSQVTQCWSRARGNQFSRVGTFLDILAYFKYFKVGLERLEPLEPWGIVRVIHFCAKGHAPWSSILTIVIDGRLFWRQGHRCPDYLKERILQYAI